MQRKKLSWEGALEGAAIKQPHSDCENEKEQSVSLILEFTSIISELNTQRIIWSPRWIGILNITQD